MQYDWKDVEKLCLDVSRQVTLSGWTPEYIVGVESSGLVPALLISNFLSIPLETINSHESNCWMSEDAFNGKNILLVDALTDFNTLEAIKDDWMGTNLPKSENWDNVWSNNVRFATLVHDNCSEFGVDYNSVEFSSIDESINVNFPWENFWRK